MNKFKVLLSNTIIFAIGNFITKILQLFLMPLYTSYLTTKQYGTADLLSNSIELLLPIMTLGITEAVFRFSIDKDSDQKKLLSLGIQTIMFGFFIFAVLMIFLDRLLSFQYSLLFTVLYLSAAIRQLFAQFTRGIGHAKLFALSGIIGAVTLLLGNVTFLVIFHKGVQGYLSAIILANFASIIYLYKFAKLRDYLSIRIFNSQLLKVMVIYSLPAIPNMLSWWFTNISSRYIIVGFCGAGTAGLFSAASKLPSMINLLSTIFQQAWQFSSSKEYGEKNSNQFYSSVFKFYSTFIIIVSSFIIVMIPFISKLILKGDFYEAWIYVPLLTYSAVIGCFSYFFGAFYLAAKKNKIGMVSTLVGAFTNIIISLVLVPFYGVYGALVASVISFIIIAAIRVITTRKYVQIKASWIRVGSSLFLILLQCIFLTINNRLSFEMAILILLVIISINIKEVLEGKIYIKKLLDRK